MTEYGTHFLETEALLAVAADDTIAALTILDKMLPGELTALGAHARRLGVLCDVALKGGPT